MIINQLAFPGLGTIMAGRRSGYVQAAIMLSGFFLSVGFMLWYFLSIARYLAHSEWSDEQYKELYRPYVWVGLSGLALCFAAWCWAGVSSIAILRSASASATGIRET